MQLPKTCSAIYSTIIIIFIGCIYYTVLYAYDILLFQNNQQDTQGQAQLITQVRTETETINAGQRNQEKFTQGRKKIKTFHEGQNKTETIDAGQNKTETIHAGSNKQKQFLKVRTKQNN